MKQGMCIAHRVNRLSVHYFMYSLWTLLISTENLHAFWSEMIQISKG